MVPFRSSRTRSQALAENTSNRSRPGQIDHDVFEGLPVRRWSRQPATFSQTPKAEELDTSTMGSHILPELPMPRDSQLLTPLSRALLRAARAGCTYIKPVRKNPDVAGKEAKGEDSAGTSTYERTFTAVKWSAIPRNLEPPEVEFLAKRRPGLYSVSGAAAVAHNAVGIGIPNAGNQAPMRKTKFKKADSVTGMVSIYEAWVPEGHRVEGEIADEAEITADNPDGTIVSASPAPGTVVEGVGVVDQEGIVVAEPEGSRVAVVRRRHPPPKRKGKGFGRGRRKKVMFTHDDIAPSQVPGNEGTRQDATGQGLRRSSCSDQEGKSGGGDEEEEEEEEDDDDGEAEGSEDDEESGDDSKSQPKSEAPTTTPSAAVKEETTVHLVPQQESSTSKSHDKLDSSKLPPSEATADCAETTTMDQQVLSTENAKPEASSVMPAVASSTDAQPAMQEKEPESTDQPKSPSTKDETPNKTDEAAPAATSPDNAPLSIPAPTSPEKVDPEAEPTSEPLQTSDAPPAPSSAQEEPIRFEDGEVDLLGSLEASLDNPPQKFKEDKSDAPPEQPAEKDEDDDVTMID
ncbi:hypothetical protein PRK78_003004 [Emydomyces testavorans]|uniref:Uncharacterized protein n=1 Tax=Emydomyces testavorans TaxID=2070801 RepID=A0AAF0II38_9EURO|nr:hypothetical protein PRK78_003004 [Emydomyces testavorans]